MEIKIHIDIMVQQGLDLPEILAMIVESYADGNRDGIISTANGTEIAVWNLD